MSRQAEAVTGKGGGPAARPCPVCGKPATAASTPFCSPRCADVDLHRWLAGAYVVPGDAAPGEAEEAGADAAEEAARGSENTPAPPPEKRPGRERG